MQRWQMGGWAVMVVVGGGLGSAYPAVAGDIQNTELSSEQSLASAVTTVGEWIAQIEASLVQITEVRVEETETGLQVTLETAAGELTVAETRTVGNALIADIPNATLAEEISQANPVDGIALVSVTQLTANAVRVAITGTDAPPVAEVRSGPLGLVLAVTLGDAVVGAEDEAIQVVVTGEQDEGFNPLNASVGTRTNTPLRDIPFSIQVIPQQILEDRQVRSITEGLENVAGVTLIAPASSGRDWFTLRGFENFGGFLVNGIPEPRISINGSFVNAERLEVLRGPAAALYGEVGSLSGTINLVTRQPLSDPFYEVSAAAGSYNDYQGTFDVSGPLNSSGTVLYRLIGSYNDFGSFFDFGEGNETFIAPSLALRGPNTDFILEGDISILNRQDGGPAQPVLGTVLENPNGEINRSFNPQGPGNITEIINARIGYRLEHRFSDNWRFQNAFRYSRYDDSIGGAATFIFSDSLAEDNRTLGRTFFSGAGYADNLYIDANLAGKFNTGSIEHQILIGFSHTLDRIEGTSESGEVPPVDIFNPVFDQTVNLTGQPDFDSLDKRDTLGIYVQDQITITDSLKLLLGGRVDFFDATTIDRIAGEQTSQSDTAFSPRVGIVYQPIPPISLYASYASSFVPTIGLAANGDTFRPERGTQYEIGIKADISDQLSANLALYDLTRSNVTTPDPENPIFSVQTGRVRSQGVEVDISGEILPGWNIIGGYAYTDARVVDDNVIPIGNQNYSAPEHSFSIWTTYSIQEGGLRGLGFGLGLYYTGERWADTANTLQLPGFLRTDAAIFYERDRFRTALNLRNIFDVDSFIGTGSSDFVDRGTPFTLLGTVSWQF